MENKIINLVPFTEKEVGKISKKWAKAKKIVIYFILFAVLAPVLFYVMVLFQNGKFNPLTDIYTYAFSALFLGIGLLLFFTDKFRKDYVERHKFILRTVISKYNYEQKIFFSKNLDLKMPLPLPVDFEVAEIKFYDASMQKTSAFEEKQSKFGIRLTNGYSYLINEMDFVSAGTGTFLELHVAKNSGFVLSVRKIKPEELSKEEISEFRKKYSSKTKKANNPFEDIDKPDVID